MARCHWNDCDTQYDEYFDLTFAKIPAFAIIEYDEVDDEDQGFRTVLLDIQKIACNFANLYKGSAIPKTYTYARVEFAVAEMFKSDGWARVQPYLHSSERELFGFEEWNMLNTSVIKSFAVVGLLDADGFKITSFGD